ncbi:four helix bundle protein [Robertkochia sp. 1368]|nr:four helix bundle protein [Robertkochia sediminum]
MVGLLYQLTAAFPEEEKYGLISQIRRAAVSVPANIAEGSARNTSKQFLYFINIAIGSTAEVETLLEISKLLGFTTDISQYTYDLMRIKRMLISLASKLTDN